MKATAEPLPVFKLEQVLDGKDFKIVRILPLTPEYVCTG